jgi:hypothetical protein
MKTCERRNGTSSNNTQDAAIVPYTESRHRAIIALRCSVNKRPFNIVTDPLYLLECKLLRPDMNFRLPSPATVQRDTQWLYIHLANSVVNYFKVRQRLILIVILLKPLQQRNRAIHVVFDGWTSPIGTAHLGIVIIWEDAGCVKRATLDLVR